MASKRELLRDNEALRGEVETLRGEVSEALEIARIGSYAMAESVTPSTEDLKKLARDYPMWSVSWGTVEDDHDGVKVVKTFERDISDLRPELHDDRDTYLRLADNEYFDFGLIDVFRKTCADPRTYVSGDGVYCGKADGGFAGGHISIDIEGETSLTKLDLIRIEAAEQYLVSENIFGPEAITA